MSERNHEIDFFRLVFALFIMGHHASALLGWNHCKSGAIGVEFFFVVAGVFFARSIKRVACDTDLNPPKSLYRDSVRFIFHKISIFYPYFLFSCIVGFIVHQLVPGIRLWNILENGVGTIWELLLVQTAGFTGYWPTGTGWYLSALILAQWILYPLARKNYHRFIYWFSPLAVILLNGIFSENYTSIHGTVDLFLGFASRGILRAVNEIYLGSIAFEVATWLGKLSLTKLARGLLTALEVFCYGATIASAWYMPITQYDYVLLLLIAIAVSITISGQGLIGSWFRGRLPLAKFSLVLFMNHFYWALAIQTWLPNWSVTQKTLLFFGISFLTSFICLVVVDAIKKSFKPEAWKKRLIKEETV